MRFKQRQTLRIILKISLREVLVGFLWPNRAKIKHQRPRLVKVSLCKLYQNRIKILNLPHLLEEDFLCSRVHLNKSLLIKTVKNQASADLRWGRSQTLLQTNLSSQALADLKWDNSHCLNHLNKTLFRPLKWANPQQSRSSKSNHLSGQDSLWVNKQLKNPNCLHSSQSRPKLKPQ